VTGKPLAVEKYEFHALTPQRWADFEQLFSTSRNCMGCWCMWNHMTNRDFTRAGGSEGLKEAMRTIVHSGFSPGILGYADGIAAGWVALAPREWYARLKTSRHLAPVDDRPVWSVTCFFIHHDYRHVGMMEKLLGAAIDYARTRGATILEAYPLDVKEKISTASLFSGRKSVFERLGFEQAALRDYRPIMRMKL
jgi:GNAT superfamily N-acetyltransferase